jgi:tRNA(adenine34) deaminase
MNQDEKWMQIAIIEATLAKSENEVPVGAVIIKNGQLISQAHNQPISTNDPTAHAEIQAIRKAGQKQKNYRLVGTTLYVTLEPCVMCLGAMIHARVERIVFGAYDHKTGECSSCNDLNNVKKFNHELSITGGILEDNCKELLHSFFKLRRK